MNRLQMYNRKRDAVLLKGDPEELRKLVKDNAEYFREEFVKAIEVAPVNILEITLHKMIVNVKSMPKSRRNDSAKWLLDRGFSGDIC